MRTRVLAAISVLCVGLLLPAAAYAAPRVTVQSFTPSFTKGSGRMELVLKSTESGSARMEVTDSHGNRIAVQNRPTVKKGTAYKSTWTGRTTGSNEVGLPGREYVASGRYKVVVTTTTRSGSARTVRYVQLKNPARPQFSWGAYTTSVTPSATAGARAMRVPFTTSVRYDVTVRIISKDTGRTVAEQRLRDVRAGRTKTVYWDGQVTRPGSVQLPSGELAVAGDVAPPGSYIVRLYSRGVTTSRSFRVLPARAASVAVAAPSGAQMNYDQSQQLVASVLPRGVVNSDVTWSSSDESILTVASDGTVTSGRKEGKAVITATSLQTLGVSGSVTLSVRSDSTLAVSGFSVPKWTVHGASVALSGTISSNQQLQWIRIKVSDSTGATELEKTVYPGEPGFPSGKSVSIRGAIDRFITFGTLSPGEKVIRVYAQDDLCRRTLHTQKFLVIGPTAHVSFWSKRAGSWVFPLDSKGGYTSPFGSFRDGGSRAHAAIDFIQPAGTKVYAMADGVVERISAGTYYAGTGAVQVKHSDGSVIWYCEVKAAKGLKVGDKVAQNQHIATIQTNDYGTAMLHLEAYSGKRTGSLYAGSNTGTYDYVTPAPFLRRRDLISPMGVSTLSIPPARTVEVR